MSDRPATEPRTEAGRRLAEADAQALWSPAEVRAAILAIEAEAAQGAAPLDMPERDKTVENLIIALAYRYDADERGTPCFCVSGDAVDGEGRIISHTPRCRSARISLDRWSEGAAPRAEGLLRRLVSDFDPFDYEQGLCYWCEGGWEQVPGPRGGKGKWTHTGKHKDGCPFDEATRLSHPSDERVPESGGRATGDGRSSDPTEAE